MRAIFLFFGKIKKEILKFCRILFIGSGILNNELINEIRKSVNIVDVISSYMPLTKKGKNYFGVCPFHDDHSPSMSVAEDKQIYKCFSCGESGNVFTFLEKYENISFLEAVKKCADLSGIEFNYGKSTQKNYNQDLYDIYKFASKLYQNNLHSKEGKEARDYLKNRKLDDNIIKEFEIGLSLNQASILTDALKKKYDEKTLIKSGLVSEGDYNLYDIYRNRIMFPLYDLSGNIVGYNGRIYNSNNKNDSKYINSKETPIFKKGELLFNYHRAKKEAREYKFVIVVEGQIDAIRCYQAGYKNVVASLGTAITKEHAMLLRKLSNNIVLCFDGDSAGEKATNAAIEQLSTLALEPKIVRLEESLDPDEYILKYGKERFKDKIENALNIMQYKEIIIKKDMDLSRTEDLALYTNKMIKEINNINDDVLREISINKLASETNLEVKFIKSKLDKKKEIKIPIKKNIIKYSKYEKSEQALIYYMLKSIDVIKIYEKKITFMPTDRYRKLALKIDCFYKEFGYIDVADFMTYINGDDISINALSEILNLDFNDSYDEEAILDYLNNIKSYNDRSLSNKYKKELKEEVSLEKKIELAKKAIEYKIRSESNE